MSSHADKLVEMAYTDEVFMEDLRKLLVAAAPDSMSEDELGHCQTWLAEMRCKVVLLRLFDRGQLSIRADKGGEVSFHAVKSEEAGDGA